ncbi:CKS1-like protein, partial [Mya arenaria]
HHEPEEVPPPLLRGSPNIVFGPVLVKPVNTAHKFVIHEHTVLLGKSQYIIPGVSGTLSHICRVAEVGEMENLLLVLTHRGYHGPQSGFQSEGLLGQVDICHLEDQTQLRQHPEACVAVSCGRLRPGCPYFFQEAVPFIEQTIDRHAVLPPFRNQCTVNHLAGFPDVAVIGLKRSAEVCDDLKDLGQKKSCLTMSGDCQNSAKMPADQITYSEKYNDEKYEYRHVILPPDIAKQVPKTHLMSETEATCAPVSTTRAQHRAPKRSARSRSADSGGALIELTPVALLCYCDKVDYDENN